MSDAGDFLGSFSVVCPRCECRFQPEVRSSPYFARCPDCAEPVRVPASAEIEDDWCREQASESTGDTYRLSVPTDWDDGDDMHFAAYPSEPNQPPEVRRETASDPQPPEIPAADQDSHREPNEKEPAASTATCPACGANFEATPSEKPQVVLCPECLEDVPIPPAQQRPPAPEHGEAAKSEDSGTRPSETKAPDDERIPWDFYLTDSPPAESLPKKPEKKRKKKSEAEIRPAENPTRMEKPRKHVDEVLAEIRQVEVDPPPEWTFFSGVTNFLNRPEVLVRWIFSSIGFCLMGWLVALCVHFYVTDTILALPFFVLPLIWIGIMTLSYAAASSTPILLETAAGNDKIEGWPEPVMKEQAVDLVYLSFLLIVAEVLSFLLGQLVGILFGPQWLIWLVLTFLLYPIVLLSSLEANSPYVPLTWPILKSLQKVGWAWGVFYGLSFGLTLAWALPAVWLLGRSGWTQFIGMVFLAPLLAGWCFLYARLLGRLAWRASLEFEEEDADAEKPENEKTGKRKRKGKKKPKISESSGELQATR